MADVDAVSVGPIANMKLLDENGGNPAEALPAVQVCEIMQDLSVYT